MMSPLLMATATSPTLTTYYEDVDVRVNYIGEDTTRNDINNICYEVEVKNVGSKHIAPFTTALFIEDRTGRGFNIPLEQTSQVFVNQTIAPNGTEKYHTYVSKSFDFAQRFDVRFNCYEIEVNVDFTGAEIKEDYKQNNRYVLKVSNSQIPDKNLALFLDVTYKGEEKSFYMFFNSANRTFNTNEKLDLKQLTINNITAYREAAPAKNSRWSLNTVLWILLAVFFSLILAAILVPVIITSIKRR